MHTCAILAQAFIRQKMFFRRGSSKDRINSNLSNLPASGVDGRMPTPGVDVRVPTLGVDVRVPTPGVDVRVLTPGVDVRVPTPGVDVRVPTPGAKWCAVVLGGRGRKKLD